MTVPPVYRASLYRLRPTALPPQVQNARLGYPSRPYQQILDDLRVELARKYLADPRHTLSRVSALLGFGDESNFFRACKRWFGVPPGAYRRQLLKADADYVHREKASATDSRWSG